MKFKPLLSAVLLINIILGGCNPFNAQTDEKPREFERREIPRNLTESEITLVNGSGTFGFDLMHKLIEKSPNTSHFVSPLSIQMAYGMTMNGAGGTTYSQMQKTFGWEGMTRKQINESARNLLKLLTKFDKKVEFNIANAIWYRDTFDIEEDFLQTNQEYYEATIEASDFDNPETVKQINNWVDGKTKGRIKEIVQNIDPRSVMYLINAIYFKGDWTVQFDPDLTETKPFYLPDGSSVDTEMMHLEEQEGIRYKQGRDYQAVNLFYGDAGFVMTLVLPAKGVSLEDWVSNMDWNQWKELTNGFNRETVTLDMPKFEMEYEIRDLKNVLQDLGITDAFTPSTSDFSRINPARGDLFISDTRHKAFIRVDEEGTEAAAVTSVGMGVTSVHPNPSINFNRPFFYVIREVESETILFMGTMTDPS